MRWSICVFIFTSLTQILSDRKSLQIEFGVQVFDPDFTFTDEASYWGNYSSAFTRVDKVPSTWTCNSKFYGSNDGCDCNCGAWDPDCDSSSQKVFNCDMDYSSDVRCAMSATTPSKPSCLYDRVAATAARDAGLPYPSAPNSDNAHSTNMLVAVSVGSAVGAVVVAAVIGYLIKRRNHARRGEVNVALT